jgi:hypothetical protein
VAGSAGLRNENWLRRLANRGTINSLSGKTVSGQDVMLLDSLHAKRDAIESARREFGARRIRVFGSVARGEERLDSDIDFLVDFPRGYDLFRQRLPLTERLAEITGRRLDVIPEHELNPHLREAILKEAVDL